MHRTLAMLVRDAEDAERDNNNGHRQNSS